MYQWIPYGEYLYFSAAAGAKTNKGSGTASASASAWGCDHFAAWDKLFRDKQNITSINSNKGPSAKAAPTPLSTLSTCLRIRLRLRVGLSSDFNAGLQTVSVCVEPRPMQIELAHRHRGGIVNRSIAIVLPQQPQKDSARSRLRSRRHHRPLVYFELSLIWT